MAFRSALCSRTRVLLFGGSATAVALLILILALSSGQQRPVAASGAVNSIVEPLPGLDAYSASLAIDASGDPVVAYVERVSQSDTRLRVLHCGDPDCSSSNATSAIESVGNVYSASMVLDSSGDPVLAYYDSSTQNLRLLHCNDPDCAGGDDISASPDIGYQVGLDSRLILDGAGFPIVTYLDLYNYDLKLVHCGSADCTVGNSIVTLGQDATGLTVGAVRLDNLGRPIVAYQAAASLKVLHCGDANCSGPNQITQLPTADYCCSMELDGSGAPVIGYYDADPQSDSIRVLHCGNADCSGSNTTTIVDANLQGSYSSTMTLDPAGNPVLAYYAHYGSDGDLRVAHCGNADCTNGTVITVPDSAGNVGLGPQVLLDSGGNPVVAYWTDVAAVSSTRILHCITSSCLSKGQTPVPNPSPTATPTPAPCPPFCGLDFSIAVDASISGAALPCDSSGSPTATCDVPLGAKFKVSFYVHSLASGMHSGVSGEDETVQYAGITSSEMQDSVNQTYWPSCVGATGGSFSPGQVSMGCSVLLGPPSTYVGKYSTVEFTCTADGSVTLVGGTGYTDVADDDLIFYSEASDESLTIRCVPPQAYPGDTDGDGCPDAREQGMNPMMGGRRNFLNPWDYMNPTGDHMNRVDDILAVIPHFGQNVGDLGYDVKYDRTYLGPNRWNLGPPDGKIRVADILAAVSQYGQDCF